MIGQREMSPPEPCGSTSSVAITVFSSNCGRDHPLAEGPCAARPRRTAPLPRSASGPTNSGDSTNQLADGSSVLRTRCAGRGHARSLLMQPGDEAHELVEFGE